MALADLLRLEIQSEEGASSPGYKIFTCPLRRASDIGVVAQQENHRFAVMYSEPVGARYMDALVRAAVQGAMASVTLVVVRNQKLWVFLDSSVTSSTFPAIESRWAKVMEGASKGAAKVAFSSESEIYSGRSDYEFWEQARRILYKHFFRIQPLGAHHASYSWLNASLDSLRGICPDVGVCSSENFNIHAVGHAECISCGYSRTEPNQKLIVDLALMIEHHNVQLTRQYYSHRTDLES